jgi:hypothetical protein
MWEPRRLTTLLISTACYRDSFTFYNNNNNSVQFFIIYVPSQQPQGQLQTQDSVDTSNYIMGKHKFKE